MVLGLFEIGLRLCGVRFDASLFQMDPIRSYAFRPGASGWHTSENDIFVRINKEGNRDCDRSFEPALGTLRIAVLGSSTTAGLEVEQDQTYTALLERLLSKPGLKVEVLNFAVEGYGPAQDFYTMHDQVWKYHPQIVIDEVSLKQYVLNSTRKFSTTHISYPYFEPANDSVRPDPVDRHIARPTSRQISISNRFRAVVNSSELILLVTTAIKDVGLKAKSVSLLPNAKSSDSAADPRSDPWRWTLIPPPSPEISLGWQVLEGLTLRMRDEAKSHQAEFWVVVSDDAFQVNPDPAVAETLRQRMGANNLMYGDNRYEAFLSTKQVKHIHLAPALLAYAQRTKAYLHGGPKIAPGEGHWNALGHRIVALTIAQDLQRSSPTLQAFERSGGAKRREATQTAELRH